VTYRSVQEEGEETELLGGGASIKSGQAELSRSFLMKDADHSLGSHARGVPARVFFLNAFRERGRTSRFGGSDEWRNKEKLHIPF